MEAIVRETVMFSRQAKQSVYAESVSTDSSYFRKLNKSTKKKKKKPKKKLCSSPLTYVINKSFETDKFPNLLKIAKIIPIFKSSDKTMVSNYRPISVLPVFAKVYEKIIANHLLEFLNSITHFINYSVVFANIFLLAMLLFH